MSNFLKSSEAGTIGLHAMVMIANNPNRLVQIKEIAGLFKVSEAHLAKVLNRLVKSGLIEATRGPSGGYKLKKAPTEISIRDIYFSIEGEPEDNRCMFGINICDGKGCDLGDFFTKVAHMVDDRLSKTKLSDTAFKTEFYNKIANA